MLKIKKPIILTFDDNKYNHYYNVFPLLKKYNMKATYGYITRGKYNNDKNPQVIKEINDYGIEFASHTHTHMDLNLNRINKISLDLFESLNVLKSHNINNPGLICPFNRINTKIFNNIIEYFNFKYIIYESSTVNNFIKFANLKNATKYNLLRIEFPTEDQPKEYIDKLYNILKNLKDDDIPIIMFHNICNYKINTNVKIDIFENFLKYIQENNFNTFTISEIIDNLNN
jgi:peptidoglycan/xylan/chitin deacetylase (PgdA/CDA1 family)